MTETKPASTESAPEANPPGQPPRIENVHQAILAVMSRVGYVQKEKAPGLGYTFAGEAALIAAIRPYMVEYGLICYVMAVEDVSREIFTTSRGNAMNATRLKSVVRFVHTPSGTYIDAVALGEGADTGDKSSNKASTGAYKYALRQTFCIETGDDPDQMASEEMERAIPGAGVAVRPPMSSPAARPAASPLPVTEKTPAPVVAEQGVSTPEAAEPPQPPSGNGSATPGDFVINVGMKYRGQKVSDLSEKVQGWFANLDGKGFAPQSPEGLSTQDAVRRYLDLQKATS